MIEDSELLRRYAVQRTQDAFAELVRENTNIVLRQTESGWKRSVNARQVEQLYQMRMRGEGPGATAPSKPAGGK